ncbi:hypothetical protein [Roseovarius mucosus]|uniref:hypothetical protein n=1 Tax=Roseovarius mucosus TaxID=215743 RepID=UPI003F72EB77
MMLFFAILAAFIGAPNGALAEPISSAIAIALAASSAGAGTFAAIAAGFGALGAFATRIIVGAGLSLLSQAFAKKPKVNGQGIQTEQTTTGDVTPQKFVVGIYAVEGHAVAPAYSRFKNNGILTYILEVSNIPVTGLTGRIIINGKYSDIEEPNNSAGPFNEVPVNSGRRILTEFRQGDNDPTAWLWFYDGTQTAADPTLVTYYGNHVDRPWTTDHILRGTAYAVLEFALDPEIYQGLPSVRFEVQGIKLYDPRKDTTVGGSGVHRWNDPTSWDPSGNPQVINYNILRGITLPTGDVWGGRVDAEDLPLDNWFAAMNECDVDVGGRKQYVAGFEINVEEMEPVDVIEEMNRASFAQMSEFGGVFRVRVGAPAAPVLHVTDADFVITEGSVLTPFPAFDTVTNGITGTYVEPNDIWEGRDADLILNEDWVAEDGRQRVSSLGLPAVSVKAQAQQLLNAYLLDGRRFRTHQMTLPPSFALVEPLDAISFTSEAFGYTSKLFEVIEVEDRPDTLLQVVTVREREAGDVAIKPELEVAAPLPTNGQTPPSPLVVPLSVAAFDLSDATGAARRPAILLTWTIESLPAIRNLKYQVRVKATQEIVAEGTASVSDARKLVPLDTHLANTEMEAQARYVADAPTAWTPWLSVTTPDLRLTQSDLADALRDQIDTAFDRHDAVLGEAGTPQSVLDLLAEIGANIAPIVPGQPPRETLLERLDFETPQLRGIEDAMRNIEDRLVELDLSQFGLSRRLTDAGVYVDPTSGTVRIAGVDTTQERQALVEANFDALAATVSLKASLTEVNDAIAAAVLGEADLAALTELQLRVSDVEVALDAAAGTLSLLSDTLTVEGGLVTMTSVTGRLDSVEGDLLLKVDQTEFDDAEARLSDAEIQLQTIDGAGIVFAVSDQRLLRDETLQSDDAVAEGLLRAWLDGQGVREAAASGRRELTAVVTEGLEAEAAERLTLTAQVAEAQAQIVAEQVARANADEALTTSIATQAARIDTNIAAISSEATTRATADSAIASDVTSLTARVGTAEGAITTINATKVDAAGAVSAVTTEISASYGSLNALATATAFAEATADGIASGFVMRLNGANVWEAVSVADGTGGPIVTGRWSGDYLRLDGNVEITGDFILDGDLILGGSIISDKIATDAIGAISAATLTTEFVVISTTYSTVLTLTANHTNAPSEKNLILFCRLHISSLKPTDAGNVIEYRILRNGVLMSGVPPYKREVRPGDMLQEFFGLKQRTTADAASTTYALQVRAVTNGPGIAEPRIAVGTQMWTEEKRIAGLV